MSPTKQKRHKACFTDKYRKRMKEQQAVKNERKRERERKRRAAQVSQAPRTLYRSAYPVWEVEREIWLSRLRDDLVLRMEILRMDGSPGDATDLPLKLEMKEAAPPICPLCNIAITPEHYRYNVKPIFYNRRPVLVHIVCPGEPSYKGAR